MRVGFRTGSADELIEIAKFSPMGYRWARREQIAYERGALAKIRRVLYSALETLFGAGDSIFVRDLK
jgi:hypothetical protein